MNVSPFDFIDNINNHVTGSKVKATAKKLLIQTTSMIDKLAKNNILHKNKVNNLKSSLTKHVNSL